MEEDVKGEPDEPRRPVPSRRRGLGRGLGAILSAPGGMADAAGEPPLYDELTGLPNRTLLDDRLEEALVSCRHDGASLAVLVVALDGFSKVNELFGHRVGDGLLHDVAERMSATRRRSDTVARFAGDEFVVVCPYVGSADVACRMAARILEDVSRPASVDGVEHRLSASIGVVVAEPGDLGEFDRTTGERPDDRETVEILLGDASLAMRQAKDEGGASWRLFDPTMREDAAIRHQHRQDLRAAMEDGGLFLDYEPIVAVDTNAVVGASGLLGWRLPGAVVEGPDALLELVDEAGLAVPVGRWLLDQALSDVATRRATSSLPDEYRVWVKLTPSFVADPTLVEAIDELTAKHRVPSSMLGLDITEPLPSALPTVDSILQALVVRDVALALDGFGARQSNLMMLQRLPLTAFKLAPEVVAALDEGDGQEGAALVRGLVGLGRALGLTVVAQGVETPTQVAMLHALGCQFAQGPLLEGTGRAEPLWATGGAEPRPWAHDVAARLAGRIGPPPDPGSEGGVLPPTPPAARGTNHPSAAMERTTLGPRTGADAGPAPETLAAPEASRPPLDSPEPPHAAEQEHGVAARLTLHRVFAPDVPHTDAPPSAPGHEGLPAGGPTPAPSAPAPVTTPAADIWRPDRSPPPPAGAVPTSPGVSPGRGPGATSPDRPPSTAPDPSPAAGAHCAGPQTDPSPAPHPSTLPPPPPARPFLPPPPGPPAGRARFPSGPSDRGAAAADTPPPPGGGLGAPGSPGPEDDEAPTA